jgi:hypothetical protein
MIDRIVTIRDIEMLEFPTIAIGTTTRFIDVVPDIRETVGIDMFTAINITRTQERIEKLDSTAEKDVMKAIELFLVIRETQKTSV